MLLSPLEMFALEKLLEQTGTSGLELSPSHFSALGREFTAAGFYTLIKCHEQHELMLLGKELSVAFTHHALKRGGYFICWLEDNFTLCLEGVANHQDWSSEVSPESLSILWRQP